MALPPVRALELERFESTFNRARIGGAAITGLLGPFFPNLGASHMAVLTLALLGQFGLALGLVRSGRYREDAERWARVVFAIDLLVVAYAILVFSADPNWTTYMVGILLVVAGGFRFGPRGAIAATTVMSVAYVGIASFRGAMFGYVTEPQRLVFTVTVYALTGVLMAGLVRELAVLRAKREAFERQRAETEALRELDRMKSEFLAVMSHDFRSPLTVVRGNLELLQSERPGPLNGTQRDLTTRAERNVHRLEEFTEDLLEMARIEQSRIALERDDVDVCALLREVVDDHRVLADERHQRLELECAGPTIISADGNRLRRAVGNLLSNAMKYAPSDSVIRVCGSRDGKSLDVSVTDRGPGVDPDERERIFDKFARGRRSESVAGAGLGLSIARSLAELHGGTVRYEDAQGGGACFILSIPVNGA